MKDLNHPNILKLIRVCLDGGPAPFIIMPFMENGSLLSYLRKNRSTFLPTEDDVLLLTTYDYIDCQYAIRKLIISYR